MSQHNDLGASQRSRLSVKSKKKKKGKKGSRATSRQSSRSSVESGDERNLSRPDYEAEVIHSKRSKNLDMTNKADLLKPV